MRVFETGFWTEFLFEDEQIFVWKLESLENDDGSDLLRLNDFENQIAKTVTMLNSIIWAR